MQNTFHHTFFSSKIIISVILLICFQFSAFSISNKLGAKTSYESTCVVSGKHHVSKKLILIKASERIHNQSELIFQVNDFDIDFFSLEKKLNMLPLIYSASPYTFNYLISYMYYKAELTSPPPRC